MGFDVSYGKKPQIIAHDTCCRCQKQCEMAAVGTGRVPTGPDGTLETIKNIVLCLDCRELMVEIPKQFWYEGWPNQRRKKK